MKELCFKLTRINGVVRCEINARAFERAREANATWETDGLALLARVSTESEKRGVN